MPFSAADPLRGLADGCLDVLSGVAGTEGRLAALKAQAVAVYAQSAEAVAQAVSTVGMPGRVHAQAQEMAVAAELAGVLSIGERAAGLLLNQSRVLTSMLPLTLAGLQEGCLSWAHARVMVEEAATLEPALAAALEAHFLDPEAPNPARGAAPGELVPYRFRYKARAWRERHHPESLEKRHARGVADRRVEHRPDQDGMVTVPVLSLLDLTDEPAMLDGHGPVPASLARKLVANGADSFYRVLVDPRDGAPLEIGRTSYRVTKAMRNWLRLRDGKCPFPGCSNSSLDNEADHLLAWHHGGTTGISNLGQPCPKHHKLRHTTGWTPTPATKNQPPGWTSPTGRHYTSEHQDWEPPHWPDWVTETWSAATKPEGQPSLALGCMPVQALLSTLGCPRTWTCPIMSIRQTWTCRKTRDPPRMNSPRTRSLSGTSCWKPPLLSFRREQTSPL